MTVTVTAAIPPMDGLAALDASWDLTNVRMKHADPEEGPRLTTDRLDLLETEYRRFLALHLAHPDVEILPCKIVDEVWHQHILDTGAYRADCELIFGRFLDHFPYFGMRGEQDAITLQDVYDTLERYRAAFGEPPDGTWISADAASCKRTNCKPQKCK